MTCFFASNFQCQRYHLRVDTTQLRLVGLEIKKIRKKKNTCQLITKRTCVALHIACTCLAYILRMYHKLKYIQFDLTGNNIQR